MKILDQKISTYYMIEALENSNYTILLTGKLNNMAATIGCFIMITKNKPNTIDCKQYRISNSKYEHKCRPSSRGKKC